jgi:hypothetical protein
MEARAVATVVKVVVLSMHPVPQVNHLAADAATTTPNKRGQLMNRKVVEQRAIGTVLAMVVFGAGVLFERTTGKVFEHSTAKVVVVENPAPCPRC